MALGFSLLTASNDNVDAASFATASISPSSNEAVFAFIGNSRSAAPAATPTLSGAGLTWTQLETETVAARRITLFKGEGTPSAGAVTIDFAGDTQNSCDWSFVQATEVNLSSPNGTPTKGNGSTTDATATMGLFASSLNKGLMGLYHLTNEVATPDGDMTELSDAGHGSPNAALAVAYGGANDNVLAYSWATSSGYAYIAVEIKDEAAPSTVVKDIIGGIIPFAR